MFKNITLTIIFSMICGAINAAPKVKQVEIVGPAMLPVDVVNTVGVEIVGPAMLPVDVVNTVGVEIVGPAMLPVDVMNKVEVEIVGPAMLPVDVVNAVEVIGPMFLPKEIIETMISADGQPDIIDNAQVIRKIVVLPGPTESTAAACRVHVSLGGVAISHASWNGNEYGSFSLTLPGPIDVESQAEVMAQLTPLPLGGDGTCSADLVVLGTLVEQAQ